MALPEGEDANEWIAVHGACCSGSEGAMRVRILMTNSIPLLASVTVSRGLFQPRQHAVRNHHGILQPAKGEWG